MKKELETLRLLHITALGANPKDGLEYQVVYFEDRISYVNGYGGCFNFWKHERGKDASYQTLLWIKNIEETMWKS